MAGGKWESYRDIFDILDRASESEKGIRITLKDGNARIAFRHRVYKARMADRDQAKETHPPDSEHYGVSEYDHLVVKLEGDSAITITPGGTSVEIDLIEDL